MTVIRKHYDPPVRVRKSFSKPSRTKQSFQDECNINSIMAKYQKTGLINHLNRFGGDYGDFTSVQDYQTSLNQVLAAQGMFDELPAQVRRAFANDPALFLEFVSNPENRERMRDMGLLQEALTPSPPEAPSDEAPEPAAKAPEKPKAGGDD